MSLGKEKLSDYNKEYRERKQEEIHLRRSSPQGRYNQQKDAAKRRGIPWEFTFETWWKVWEDSGKWELRGRDGYMMCRNQDRGPYSPTNVRIDNSEGNVREMYGLRGE